MKNVEKRTASVVVKSFLVVVLSCTVAACQDTAKKNAPETFRETTIPLSKDYVEFLSESEFKRKGHQSVIPEYNTDASVAYRNSDGTITLYAFAVPIRFVNRAGALTNIDTRVANEKRADFREKGYSYTVATNDIIPHYPNRIGDGIVLEGQHACTIRTLGEQEPFAAYETASNFIGLEKATVRYKDAFGEGTALHVYPSLLGTSAEIHLDVAPENESLGFILETDGLVKLERGGYVTIQTVETDEAGKTVSNIAGIVQTPLVKDAGGTVSESCRLLLDSAEPGRYRLSMQLDAGFAAQAAYPVTIFTSFELRREKQPDSQLYSEKDTLNTYLSHYSVVGSHPDYGIGEALVRFNMAQPFALDPLKIRSAAYTLFNIGGAADNPLELCTSLEDWCSLTMTWQDRPKIGAVTARAPMSSGPVTFDITSEMVMWCGDGTGAAEHNGVLLKSAREEGGNWNILTSNDSALFNNYTEVILE